MRRSVNVIFKLPQILLGSFLLSGNSFAWSQVTVAGQPAENAQPPVKYALADVEIGLERTVCFGRCPSYMLRIYGDGRVVYEGRDHVRVVGTEEFTIDKANVMNILRHLYEVRFFNMANAYERPAGPYELNGTITITRRMASDLPTQIVTVKIADYEKRVLHYFGGPPDLVNLIDLIDRESGSARWIE